MVLYFSWIKAEDFTLSSLSSPLKHNPSADDDGRKIDRSLPSQIFARRRFILPFFLRTDITIKKKSKNDNF